MWRPVPLRHNNRLCAAWLVATAVIGMANPAQAQDREAVASGVAQVQIVEPVSVQGWAVVAGTGVLITTDMTNTLSESLGPQNDWVSITLSGKPKRRATQVSILEHDFAQSAAATPVRTGPASIATDQLNKAGHSVIMVILQ